METFIHALAAHRKPRTNPDDESSPPEVERPSVRAPLGVEAIDVLLV